MIIGKHLGYMFTVETVGKHFTVSIDGRSPVRVAGAGSLDEAVKAAVMMIDDIVSKQKVRAK